MAVRTINTPARVDPDLRSVTCAGSERRCTCGILHGVPSWGALRPPSDGPLRALVILGVPNHTRTGRECVDE